MHHSKSHRRGRARTSGLVTMAIAILAMLAAAVPGYARTARAAATTISVIEHASTDAEAPSVGGKDVAGNVLTFHNKIYNQADKKQVGRDEGFCIRLSVADGSWECLWTTFLKGGQITVQGPYYDKKNSVLTITGGTGIYNGARGNMALLARDGGKKYNFVFQLI
ncbi:MAG: dirigent protein [Solirubrobacteraceae bacterium]